MPRPHLAALGVVLCLVGGALLLVELRDPTPPAEAAPARPAQPTSKVAAPPAIVLVGPPDSGIALSVDEAYAAMQHPREALDESGIPADEREGLRLLLAAVDQAVRLKIALWRSCTAVDGQTTAKLMGKATELRAWLDHVPLPPGLDGYRRELSSALAGQLAFFDDWRSAGAAFDIGDLGAQPRAQASSQAVHRAYDELVRHCSGAGDHDRRVFYDRHCALDLI